MSNRRVDRLRAVERRIVARFAEGATEHRVEVPGVGAVRVVDVGSGPTVVMCHGITGTWSNLAQVLPALTGNRTLCVELPGHGLSDPLDWGERDPRPALVETVWAVVDELAPTESVALVGNSLGGMTSLYAAAARPDRTAAVGVLGEPAYAFAGARAVAPLDLVGRPGIGPLMIGTPAPALIYPTLLRRGFGRRALDNIDPDVLEAHRLSVWAGRNGRSVAGLMRRILGARGYAAPGVALTDDELDRIDMPVWLLWGSDDVFQSPESGRPTVDRLTDAEMEVVDGGHMPWLEASDAAAAGLNRLLERARW